MTPKNPIQQSKSYKVTIQTIKQIFFIQNPSKNEQTKCFEQTVLNFLTAKVWTKPNLHPITIKLISDIITTQKQFDKNSETEKLPFKDLILHKIAFLWSSQSFFYTADEISGNNLTIWLISQLKLSYNRKELEKRVENRLGEVHNTLLKGVQIRLESGITSKRLCGLQVTKTLSEILTESPLDFDELKDSEIAKSVRFVNINENKNDKSFVEKKSYSEKFLKAFGKEETINKQSFAYFI